MPTECENCKTKENFTEINEMRRKETHNQRPNASNLDCSKDFCDFFKSKINTRCAITECVVCVFFLLFLHIHCVCKMESA